MSQFSGYWTNTVSSIRCKLSESFNTVRALLAEKRSPKNISQVDELLLSSSQAAIVDNSAEVTVKQITYPIRNRPASHFYILAQYKAARTRFPAMTSTEIRSICRREFLQLPASKRASYFAAAELDRQRWEREMAERQIPRRPLNPFLIFLTEQRKLQRQYENVSISENSLPSVSATEIHRDISQKWSRMSDEEKEPYVRQSLIDRMRYWKELGRTPEAVKLALHRKQRLSKEREYESVRKRWAEFAQKHFGIKDGKLSRHKKIRICKYYKKPRSPGSPFNLFLHEQETLKLTGDTVGMAIPAYSKIMAQRWARLSSEEKCRYRQLFSMKLKEYEQELDRWKSEMIEKGLSEVAEVLTTNFEQPEHRKRMGREQYERTRRRKQLRDYEQMMNS